MFKRASWLAAVALAIAAAGCSGSDGAQGPQGAQGTQGPTGPTGPVGPVSNTAESCMVCHASDRLVQTAVVHQLPTATGTQLNLSVNVTSVADAGAGTMTIAFHVQDPNGAVTTVANGDIRVYVAGLVPGATGLTTPQADYFDRWVQERSGTYDPDGTGTAYANNNNYPFGTLTNLGSGNYTYTTVANISQAPAATTQQRLFLRVSKTGENTGNAFADFNQNFTTATNPRDIVPSAACNKCHVDRIADHGHGGGYNDTRACVLCHSPLFDETGGGMVTPPFTVTPHDMQKLGFDFPTLIHQAHSGYNNSAATDANGNKGVDFTGTVFPAQMKDCTVCHTGGAASDNYKTKPSRMACGGCHTNVNFATGAGHSGPLGSGGVRTDDSLCGGCHGPADIVTYHSVTPAPTDPTYTATLAPEYQVTMTISPPASGSFYKAGETPTVTVTLKDAAGNAVPGSLYVAAKDAAGKAGGGLAAANLYVYGPREAPMPVLTAGAAVTPVPKQATSLLLPSTDPSVLTTVTGFQYKLKAIPATLKAGTYMVRFFAQDYGYVSDTNFRVSSNAFTTIQIGSATASKKISGDCTRCHGTFNAPFHDARHAVAFNTDECVSCHDLSGNYANTLANRAHSVHAAEKTGDIHGIDWSPTGEDIRYPVGTKNGGVQNCAVCHSSGNVQYTQSAADTSCRGCHADVPSAEAHFLQNGGDY